MAFQGDSIFWVEVGKIVPNPFQPRREFNEAKLKELSESVRMYGILQPLTVTRKEIQRDDGAFHTEYELIAGERRLRASKLAGLLQVPVIIREGEDSEQEKLELAIIENLQREDLNAVDRALAFRQLAKVFGLSHAAVAKKVGRSREYVSNTMRLLLLPDYMLESLKVTDITEGHARTLLMLNDRPEEQDTVYREILLKKLSVREVERIVRKIAQDKVRNKKWKDTDPALIEIEKQFTETLGTRVQIAKTDYGGKLSIDYFSDEDLEKLLVLMSKGEKQQKANLATMAVASEIVDTAYDNDEAYEKLAAASPLEYVAPAAAPQEAMEIELDPETIIVEPEPAITPETPETAETAETVARLEAEMAEIPEVAEVFAAAETPEPEITPVVQPEEVSVAQPDVAEPQALPQTDPVAPPKPAQSELVVPVADTPFIDEAVETEKKEDDSGLYDIKNFGV